MKRLIIALLIAALAATMFTSVSAFAEERTVFTVTTADDWTALFDRRNITQRDWLGADGIYSVSLDGDDSFASADESTKTLFIFSDTITGKSDGAGRVENYRMPNHSAAVLSGDQPDKGSISFVLGKGGNGNIEQNLFTDRRMWLLDCFVTGGSVYILGFPPTNDWKPQQIEMFSMPIEYGEPNFEKYCEHGAIPELFYRDNRYLYAFGIGVTCNTESAKAPSPDGYIYIYGYRDAMKEMSRKDLIVARIKESDFPDFSKVTFFTGDGWGTDIESCAVLLSDVSCEMSVSPIETGPYNGKYIAVYNKGTEGSDIMYAVGDSLVGPFEAPVCFYKAPEHNTVGSAGNGTRYTYNAKAHPALSSGSKLLVSYNVNVRCDFPEYNQWTVDYHPRFLWLDLGSQTEQTRTVSRTAAQISSDGGTLRLIAAVDGLDYENVGFELTVEDSANGESSKKTVSDTVVYSSLAFGDTTVAPSDFGIYGGYLAVLCVESIPDSFSVTVRFFATDQSDPEKKYYGDEATFYAENGEFVLSRGNLAPSGAAIADSVSNQYQDREAENINDSDLNSRWQSDRKGNNGEDAWCGIRFDEPTKMSRVVIRWETAHPAKDGFKMQISNDGETWTDTPFTFVRDEGEGDDRQTDTVTLTDSPTALCVRVYCFKAYESEKEGEPKEYTSVYEFEVYR